MLNPHSRLCLLALTISIRKMYSSITSRVQWCPVMNVCPRCSISLQQQIVLATKTVKTLQLVSWQPRDPNNSSDSQTHLPCASFKMAVQPLQRSQRGGNLCRALRHTLTNAESPLSPHDSEVLHQCHPSRMDCFITSELLLCGALREGGPLS